MRIDTLTNITVKQIETGSDVMYEVFQNLIYLLTVYIKHELTSELTKSKVSV